MKKLWVVVKGLFSGLTGVAVSATAETTLKQIIKEMKKHRRRLLVSAASIQININTLGKMHQNDLQRSAMDKLKAQKESLLKRVRDLDAKIQEREVQSTVLLSEKCLREQTDFCGDEILDELSEDLAVENLADEYEKEIAGDPA